MFALSQQERCKHRNIKDLQLAFSEFYLSLILLQNYQVSLAGGRLARGSCRLSLVEYRRRNRFILFKSMRKTFRPHRPSKLSVVCCKKCHTEEGAASPVRNSRLNPPALRWSSDHTAQITGNTTYKEQPTTPSILLMLLLLLYTHTDAVPDTVPAAVAGTVTCAVNGVSPLNEDISIP